MNASRIGFVSSLLAAAALGILAPYAAADPPAVAEQDTAATSPSPFRFEDVDGRLTLYEQNKPVLSYIHTMHLAVGVPEDRRRSCYVHPLYGLDGEMLTDDFPKDHYHHRGLFWTWPKVIIGNDNYDQWTIRGANRRFVKWLKRDTEPTCAVLSAQNKWVVKDKSVLRETIRFQVFRADDTFRFIDVALTLQPLERPVTLSGRDKKGYGGFCFRAGKRTDTVLTVPAGRLPRDDNLTPFDWADLSATFAGRRGVSGVAIFPHPANPGTPNGWTLRHYGFLGVAWPGTNRYTISPNDPLTLRYRVAIHRGPASVPQLARAYQRFIGSE